MKTPKLFTLAMLLAMAAASSHAAVITWQTPTTISGVTDVSTTGTLERAYNLTNATGGGASINGVPFLAFNVTTNTSTSATVGNTTISSTANLFSTLGAGSASAPFSSLNTSYGTMLGQAVFSAGGTATMTLTLNALTIGQGYLFQIWSNESSIASLKTLVVAAGNSVTLDSNVGNVVGGVGQFAVGTFTADATSQAMTLTGVGGSNAGYVNGFQLRAIPEPSSIALLMTAAGVCLHVLGRRRTQKKA